MIRTTPKYGDIYRFLKFGEQRVLISQARWHGTSEDLRRKAVGNVFSTLHAAKAARAEVTTALKTNIG